MPELTWQKSTYSAQGANCVYVAATPTGTVHLRESDDPDVILTTTRSPLLSLIRTLKEDSQRR
ncbi:DUF397 domain-containing protein [Streptomyces avermitilis]|uniref:DUF397 domain-containing protein n=1 Tax=Streptomyces avermitilis TaxID=33903 RepID=UPI0033B582E3